MWLQLNALHTDLANQMADSMVFPLIQFREKDLTGSSAHTHSLTHTHTHTQTHTHVMQTVVSCLFILVVEM